MAWRWMEHTGELELEAEAPTPEKVFAEGLAAMAELLGQEGEAVASSSPATPCRRRCWDIVGNRRTWSRR